MQAFSGYLIKNRVIAQVAGAVFVLSLPNVSSAAASHANEHARASQEGVSQQVALFDLDPSPDGWHIWV